MVDNSDASLSLSFIRKKRNLFFLMKLEQIEKSKLSTIPVSPIMSLFNQFSTRLVLIGRELPIEFSKLTCSAKLKNLPGTRGMRSIKNLAAVSHHARTARQISTWERGKICQRRRIHTQKTRTITIIDTQMGVRVGESK